MSNNYYEQTYIIQPVLDDEQYAEITDVYRTFINDNGGSVDEVEEWGSRQLAYEMDGQSSGYYVNTYFEAPGSLIEELERQQRIDDNIMRYLTLKYDAKMMRHRELQKKNAVPQLIDHSNEEEAESEEE